MELLAGHLRTCLDHRSLANAHLVTCTAGDVDLSTNPPSSTEAISDTSAELTLDRIMATRHRFHLKLSLA